MSQESILGPYLKPGTPIKVGSYSTKIIRYLSEGGFSHVYTAKLDIPVKGSDVAVLKRIVAPDKAALAAIRTEVETMVRRAFAAYAELTTSEKAERTSLYCHVHRFTCFSSTAWGIRSIRAHGILSWRR